MRVHPGDRCPGHGRLHECGAAGEHFTFGGFIPVKQFYPPHWTYVNNQHNKYCGNTAQFYQEKKEAPTKCEIDTIIIMFVPFQVIPHDLPGTVTVLSLRGNRKGLSLTAAADPKPNWPKFNMI